MEVEGETFGEDLVQKGSSAKGRGKGRVGLGHFGGDFDVVVVAVPFTFVSGSVGEMSSVS